MVGGMIRQMDSRVMSLMEEERQTYGQGPHRVLKKISYFFACPDLPWSS